MPRKKGTFAAGGASSSKSKDTERNICCFCNTSENDELIYGKFYKADGIVTHYYCLLLSSNMEQKGEDDEGILGFLPEDISKEVRRGKKLHCSYCKKAGATLGCCNQRCKKAFHYPCGLKNNSLHQFFGEFRSYCITHRPKQLIDERVKKEVAKMTGSMQCSICYEDVQPLDSNNTLWAPCCKKSAWFHRKCVQQLAMSAGYFFKCPLCNNKKEFQIAMLEHGIYIPRQDASWERVPNAYEELLYRHDRCDAKNCKCPKGRTHTDDDSKWELALCRMCGSQGTHLHCGGLKSSSAPWECQECKSILGKKVASSNSWNQVETASNDDIDEVPNSRAGCSTTNGIVLDNSSDDSDSDISVGNESTPVGTIKPIIETVLPQIKLRPGPKSFKLQQVQKLQSMCKIDQDDSSPVPCSSISTISQNSSTSSKSTSPIVTNVITNSRLVAQSSLLHANLQNSSTSEVICIDSDDETVEILCESLMSKNRRVRNGVVYKRLRAIPKSDIPSCIDIIDDSVCEETINKSEEIKTLDEVNSPCELVITNVTSIPAEFFASETESESNTDNLSVIVEKDKPSEVVEKSVNNIKLDEINSDQSGNSSKRKASDNDSIISIAYSDDESDKSTVIDRLKRPRLEKVTTQNQLPDLLLSTMNGTCMTNNALHDENNFISNEDSSQVILSKLSQNQTTMKSVNSDLVIKPVPNFSKLIDSPVSNESVNNDLIIRPVDTLTKVMSLPDTESKLTTLSSNCNGTIANYPTITREFSNSPSNTSSPNTISSVIQNSISWGSNSVTGMQAPTVMFQNSNQQSAALKVSAQQALSTSTTTTINSHCSRNFITPMPVQEALQTLTLAGPKAHSITIGNEVPPIIDLD